jgi:hypothetical protein
MKKEIKAVEVQPLAETAEVTVETVHPLKKSYMIVSNKSVDYENLTTFEAVSMSLVFVLSVAAGMAITLVS